MSGKLARRTLLAAVPAAGLAAALPGNAWAAVTAYAAFRVVRAQPGELDQPSITLPPGYEIVAGERYSVASRAEFYTFVTGAYDDAGIEITVDWPDVPVEAVVHQERRLPLRRDPDNGHRFSFTLPMVESSVDANQPTIQVWSYPDISLGMYWRIEHNDANRGRSVDPGSLAGRGGQVGHPPAHRHSHDLARLRNGGNGGGERPSLRLDGLRDQQHPARG